MFSLSGVQRNGAAIEIRAMARIAARVMELSTLGEIDNLLRNRALCLAADLELHLDCSQNFAGLRSDGIGAVRHDVLMLQIGQCFPKDILQAASRERPNDGCDLALASLRAHAVALCSCNRFRI